MASQGVRISFHLNSTFAVFAKESRIIIHLTCIFKYYSLPFFCPPNFKCDFRGDFSRVPAGTQYLNKPRPLPVGVPGIALLLPFSAWEWLTCLNTVQRESHLSLLKCLEAFVHLIPIYFNRAFSSQELSLRPDLASPEPVGVRFWP